FEERLVGGKVAAGEEFLRAFFVETESERRMDCECIQFAGEREYALPAGIDKRLLAEAIAGKKQFAATAIEDGEGEHAVEADRQVLAPLLVAVNQRFGVRVIGREHVAACFQLIAQF